MNSASWQPASAPAVGDRDRLLDRQIGRLQRARRAGEGAVAADVAAQLGQRDEDLGRVADDDRMGEITPGARGRQQPVQILGRPPAGAPARRSAGRRSRRRRGSERCSWSCVDRRVRRAPLLEVCRCRRMPGSAPPVARAKAPGARGVQLISAPDKSAPARDPRVSDRPRPRGGAPGSGSRAPRRRAASRSGAACGPTAAARISRNASGRITTPQPTTGPRMPGMPRLSATTQA